jgi:hypothetical protein
VASGVGRGHNRLDRLGGRSLLLPNTMMVSSQRYIHIIEIMTQNVLLGVTEVLLLRPSGDNQVANQSGDETGTRDKHSGWVPE